MLRLRVDVTPKGAEERLTQRIDTPKTFGNEVILRPAEAEDLTEKFPWVCEGVLGGLPPDVYSRQPPSLGIVSHKAQNSIGTT